MFSYSDYISSTQRHFSFWKDVFEHRPPHPNLLSFKTVTLDIAILKQAQEFITTIYKLRNNVEYQKKILGHPIIQPHYSVLMSFDFHLTSNLDSEELKLIEINTNASHAFTNYSLLNYMHPNRNQFQHVLEKIYDSFILEYELFFNKKPESILIVDDNPLEQKAYFEFLLYKSYFEHRGLNSTIADVQTLEYKNSKIFSKETSKDFDFIYNRHTDFYLEHSPALKEAYTHNRVCLTPHPEEYQLLADKNRLLLLKDTAELSHYLNSSEIEIIQSRVPEIRIVDASNFEESWAQRKKYFFKPAQSFGSKAAYKGESVSRKKLLSAMSEQKYVAQHYISAPELEVSLDGHMQKAKYDLRFYVYNGEIQLVCARMYQGQTTNFKTPGLGFAAVLFQ